LISRSWANIAGKRAVNDANDVPLCRAFFDSEKKGRLHAQGEMA
jgi:hypothetical protein